MRELSPGHSALVGASELAAMCGRSKRWGLRLMRQWWEEQQRGGPTKVLRRGRNGVYYTTRAVLSQIMPHVRDEQMHRRIASLERDVNQLFLRLAEVERRIGRRR